MTALYLRMHHCIGDGVSLVLLLNSISDEHWEKEIRQTKPKKRNLFQFIGNFLKFLMLLIGIAFVLLHWFRGFIENLLPGRPPRKFKPKKLSLEHEIAWDREVIELQKAKDIISHIENSFEVKQHITLNDLMMSCMAQALSRYYKDTFNCTAKSLPVGIPVNVSKKQLKFIFFKKN